MNKVNYNDIFNEQISKVKATDKILLHVCCAPCLSGAIKRFEGLNLTLYFYNPNIMYKEEYDKRAQALIEYVDKINKGLAGVKFDKKVRLIIPEYDNLYFLNKISGFENEKEGGKRCSICFALRLQETYEFAKDNYYKYFCTTLTVSPHKDADIINRIGQQYEGYIPSDFKKNDGYLNSIKECKKHNIYRQTYCGCLFSTNNIKK